VARITTYDLLLFAIIAEVSLARSAASGGSKGLLLRPLLPLLQSSRYNGCCCQSYICVISVSAAAAAAAAVIVGDWKESTCDKKYIIIRH
jgi:hypothetical protein